MKHEFEAAVCACFNKSLFSIPYAIIEACGVQGDDEFVKFVVPTDNIVQWNGQKIRVTIETE